MQPATVDSPETETLLARAAEGDRASFERLFSIYRDELRKLIEWRTDWGLQARVDASDIVQDAHFEAYRRLEDFLRRRPMPFRIWLRKTAQEQLAKARRRHLSAQVRSVGREVPLGREDSSHGPAPVAARQLTPSQQVAAAESAERVKACLAELSDDDREILVMRNYERLSYEQIAMILDIEPAAARKRFGRALLRLRQRLIVHGVTESHL